MDARTQLIEVFADTRERFSNDRTLIDSARQSADRSRFYSGTVYPLLQPQRKYESTWVRVTRNRTLQAAKQILTDNPFCRAAVHNFASATRAGGGVETGSRAQEECLCRCSTLYKVLHSPFLQQSFYRMHRELNNKLYTDACIYSPQVTVFKTDEAVPAPLPQEQWYAVDVLTCAAPNLNRGRDGRVRPETKLSAEELLSLHCRRARHLLSVAAYNGADFLVLGAFGCGAFRNDPKVVSAAYRKVLPEFAGRFAGIEFAVYARNEGDPNYKAFQAAMSDIGTMTWR